MPKLGGFGGMLPQENYVIYNRFWDQFASSSPDMGLGWTVSYNNNAHLIVHYYDIIYP